MIPSNGRRRRRDGTRRGEGAGERDTDQQQQQQQQDCWRQRQRVLVSPRTQSGRSRYEISFAVMAAAGFALVAGKGGVSAQWTDGGAVTLTCEDLCDCSGGSDDGTLTVFDNPSSGDRIVSVDGAYYGILETTCGSFIVEIGGTIYELSGLDGLEDRDLEVLSMSPSPVCDVSEVPTDADCYSAPTETMSLTSDVTVDIDFHYATWTSGTTTNYKSKSYSTVSGATEVEYTFQEFCGTNGFVSQVFTIGVLGETYKFNFEFEIPGDPTSSDLSVEDAPSAQAGAFICGELAPTPAPVIPSTSPPPPPTPSPTVPIEPPPTPQPTAAPVPPPTASPAQTPPVATTDPPVVAVTETPAPVAAPTEPPIGAVTTAAPVGTTVTPVGETVAPVAVETAAPSSSPAPVNGTVVQDTVAPSPASAPETAAPSAAGGGTNGTQSPVTVAPSAAGIQETATPAPSFRTEEYVEENACILPPDDQCTETTPYSNLRQGLGEYYDLACNSSALAEGEELPEGCSGSDLCRLCYFNTPLYEEMNETGSAPGYPDCPCCVLDFYDVEAVNLDGTTCAGESPAPVAGVNTRGFDTMGFEDAGWEMNPGEVAALTALGLLAALTFFPFCSK